MLAIIKYEIKSRSYNFKINFAIWYLINTYAQSLLSPIYKYSIFELNNILIA